MVLLAGVAGAVGVAGWLDISLTSTWEGGEISLTPASSLLALNVALTLLQGWGKLRPLQILVAVLALAAGGTLAILLWAGLAGAPLEGIWRDCFTSAASRRAGGGSPWTAASWTLFPLLAAIGLLGLFPPLAARRWGRVVSITAVLLGVTFSLLVAAVRAAGAEVLIPLVFRPTASFTAVGFAALFVGIELAQGVLARSLVLFGGSVAADLPDSPQERRKRLYLALAVLSVVLATALGGTGSRIVEVNDCALHMYGRTTEAFLTFSACDLRADEVRGSTVIEFATAIGSTGKLFETVHRRSDGTTFDVEVSARPVEIEGWAHVRSIIRDVSLRKQQQQEIENLRRRYRVISQIAVTLQVDATQARLAIADKGIGIPEADIKRIFDAFERGSNVGLIKGSGLGLNIVKRMTDILGGKVTVESTLGVGTCFTVEIPARNAGAA